MNRALGILEGALGAREALVGVRKAEEGLGTGGGAGERGDLGQELLLLRAEGPALLEPEGAEEGLLAGRRRRRRPSPRRYPSPP